MKIHLLLLILIINIHSLAQVPDTTKPEKKVIIGSYTWNKWLDSCGWNEFAAQGYEPELIKIEILKQLSGRDSISFLLIGASWCGDSKSEMPKIKLLFDRVGLESDQLKIIAVDRSKREPTGLAELYNIKRVPTLIILKHNKEIGRIVEFPEITWEDDLIAILTK